MNGDFTYHDVVADVMRYRYLWAEGFMDLSSPRLELPHHEDCCRQYLADLIAAQTAIDRTIVLHGLTFSAIVRCDGDPSFFTAAVLSSYE